MTVQELLVFVQSYLKET